MLIEDKILGIIQEASGKDASTIKRSDAIKDIIEDSIFIVELILRTESTFNFSILDTEFEKLITIGDFIDFVKGREKIWNEYKKVKGS
jgi:acyl carrier protein